MCTPAYSPWEKEAIGVFLGDPGNVGVAASSILISGSGVGHGGGTMMQPQIGKVVAVQALATESSSLCAIFKGGDGAGHAEGQGMLTLHAHLSGGIIGQAAETGTSALHALLGVGETGQAAETVAAQTFGRHALLGGTGQATETPASAMYELLTSSGRGQVAVSRASPLHTLNNSRCGTAPTEPDEATIPHPLVTGSGAEPAVWAAGNMKKRQRNPFKQPVTEQAEEPHHKRGYVTKKQVSSSRTRHVALTMSSNMQRDIRYCWHENLLVFFLTLQSVLPAFSLWFTSRPASILVHQALKLSKAA